MNLLSFGYFIGRDHAKETKSKHAVARCAEERRRVVLVTTILDACKHWDANLSLDWSPSRCIVPHGSDCISILQAKNEAVIFIRGNHVER